MKRVNVSRVLATAVFICLIAQTPLLADSPTDRLMNVYSEIESERQRRKVGDLLLVLSGISGFFGLGSLLNDGPEWVSLAFTPVSVVSLVVGGRLRISSTRSLERLDAERTRLRALREDRLDEVDETSNLDSQSGDLPRPTRSESIVDAASGDSIADVATQVVSDLNSALPEGATARVFVVGVANIEGEIPSAALEIADQIQVAIVTSADRLVLVERVALESAVRETQFESFLLNNEPEKFGNLAEFAPADLVLVGRITHEQGGSRVFFRAFSTTDGVVQFAGSYRFSQSGL